MVELWLTKGSLNKSTQALLFLEQTKGGRGLFVVPQGERRGGGSGCQLRQGAAGVGGSDALVGLPAFRCFWYVPKWSFSGHWGVWQGRSAEGTVMLFCPQLWLWGGESTPGSVAGVNLPERHKDCSVGEKKYEKMYLWLLGN